MRLKFLCNKNLRPNISQASRSNQEEDEKKELKDKIGFKEPTKIFK